MTAERLAVLEAEVRRNKTDLDEFFEFVRRHMEKEERDRAELIKLMQETKTRVDRMIFFISGVASTTAIVWGVIKVLI